jgi:hypothetical protein
MKTIRTIMTATVLAVFMLVGARAGDSPYQWQSVPFGGGGYVPGYVYHPKQPNLLYARTDVGGMYRYDYGAGRWIQLLDHLGRDDGDLSGVLSIALDPNDPSKVYTANGMYISQWARKGAIMRSSDQGKTWQKTDLPIGVGGNSDGRGSGERLVVDPKNGKVLFYGSNQDGLWKSTDGAVSFGKISSPATSYSLVAVDPKNNDIYLGSAEGSGALYVSHDHGFNFARVSETPDQAPQHMAFGRDGSIYVTFSKSSGNYTVNPGNANRGSVWKRDTAGHWAEISPEHHQEEYFGYSGVDVGPDGTVVISILDRWDGGNGIYLSRDGGAHWIGLKGQTHHNLDGYPWYKAWLGDVERIDGWLSDVKINPFNPNEMIYTGTWFSRNLNDAGTGKKVEIDLNTAGLEESCVLQLASPQYGKIKVLAAMGDNAGAAWYDITKSPDVGLFLPVKTNNPSIDFAALRPTFIARTAENDTTRGYYSEDGAKTWIPFPSTPYIQPAPGQWRSAGIIAVSAGATSMVWVPEKQGAYYSLDKGKIWKESAGWPSGRDRQLAVISDKAADGVFYVFDNVASIYVSADGGAHFQPIVSGLPKIETWGPQAQLAVVPGRLRDLWLAAPYGLLHSPDSQTPMTNIKDVTTAWSVGFGAPLVSGRYPAIYLWGKVKKQEGLWRSDDEGQSWVRINDDDHQVGGPISGDMREPGIVYLAPGARGVRVGRSAN